MNGNRPTHEKWTRNTVEGLNGQINIFRSFGVATIILVSLMKENNQQRTKALNEYKARDIIWRITGQHNTVLIAT